MNAATGLISGTLTYASAGTSTVTVSVSDGTASADQTFTWTVTNVNQPPTLTDVPDRTDPENTVITIALAGADLDEGTTLTYSAAPLPAGITLNPTTGLISGTLTYASAGVHTITVSVSDGTASADQTFTWTVTNVNQPPTLTDVPDRTDPENTLVAIPLAGADPDAGTTLTYSAAPLPAGLTINPTTGVISGTLTYASAGTSTLTVSVSDGTASVDQTFGWTVTNVNQPPTLTDVPDRTDPENTVIAIALAGADLDADTTLTYSAAPLPAGVTINPATRPDQRARSPTRARARHTVTVSVSDGTASAEQTLAWTVTNVNQPPTLTDVPDRTDPENTVVAIAARGRRPGCGDDADLQRGAAPAGDDAQPDDRADQRHAHLHQCGRAHDRRVGVGRHGVGRPDLHVDRHERQSAADAHRRPRSHRPGEHRRRDRARGRRPGCGDDADLQRDAAAGRDHDQPDDRP